MADRETGSVWTHYDGSVLNGPLAGEAQLTIAPIFHATWAEWTATHPDTLVLNWFEEFADRYREYRPGRAGLSPNFERTILNWDDRLEENELVLGVNVDTEFRAYVLRNYRDQGLITLADTLGGEDIIIFIDSSQPYALAFHATLNGELLTFSVQNGAIVDDNTGSIWDLTGSATSGSLAGEQLDFATSFVTEWYGWAAYHPDTSIYGQ